MIWFLAPPCCRPRKPTNSNFKKFVAVKLVIKSGQGRKEYTLLIEPWTPLRNNLECNISCHCKPHDVSSWEILPSCISNPVPMMMTRTIIPANRPNDRPNILVTLCSRRWETMLTRTIMNATARRMTTMMITPIRPWKKKQHPARRRRRRNPPTMMTTMVTLPPLPTHTARYDSVPPWWPRHLPVPWPPRRKSRNCTTPNASIENFDDNLDAVVVVCNHMGQHLQPPRRPWYNFMWMSWPRYMRHATCWTIHRNCIIRERNCKDFWMSLSRRWPKGCDFVGIYI